MQFIKYSVFIYSELYLKYKHNFTTVYPLTDGELAVVCLLLLSGAQTPGELNTNSARLHEFKSLEGVHDALKKLMETENPFVKEIICKNSLTRVQASRR